MTNIFKKSGTDHWPISVYGNLEAQAGKEIVEDKGNREKVINHSKHFISGLVLSMALSPWVHDTALAAEEHRQRLEMTDAAAPETFDLGFEKVVLPRDLETLAKGENVRKLLETNRYKEAVTLPKLDELYQIFLASRRTIEEYTAAIVRYREFLNSQEDIDLIRVHGRLAVSKSYTQAAFIMREAVKNFYATITVGSKKEDNREGNLDGLTRGFESTSALYAAAIEFEPEQESFKNGELGKNFQQIISLNEEMRQVAKEALLTGTAEDKIKAAYIRRQIAKNISLFDKLAIKTESIYLGNDSFVFTNTNNMISVIGGYVRSSLGKNFGSQMIGGWREAGAAGMMADTASVVKYINQDRSHKHRGGTKLLRTLKANGIIEWDSGEKRYKKTESASWTIFLTTSGAYAHERQHQELLEDPRLVAYWVKEWNDKTQEQRMEFIMQFDYLQLGRVGTSYITRDISSEEIMAIIAKKKRGETTTRQEDLLYNIPLQEHAAYSTDNEGTKIGDRRHEIF